MSGEEGISAEPPRPRAALPPRLPNLRLALPPLFPSPGRAVPSLPARRLHIRYPGGSGAAGEGKVSGAQRGPAAAGMPQWLPAAPGQSPPRRGEAAGAEGGSGGRDGEMVAPPSPPTPRRPPVPHTGCIASSTRE